MRILHINSYFNGSIFYRNLYDEQVKDNLNINVFVPVSKHVDNENDFGSYTKISYNFSEYDRLFFSLETL